MTDIDTLVSDAKRLTLIDRISHEPVVAMLGRVVSVLESIAAELRQERERTQTAVDGWNGAVGRLSRAEETIARTLALGRKLPLSAERILATYIEQKGGSDD